LGQTDADPQRSRRKQRAVTGILLALILLTFVLGALENFHQGESVASIDTPAFFREGHRMQALGGPFGLFPACFKGTYQTINPRPLYPALLAFLPLDTFRALTWAKLLTMCFGAAGIVAIFFAVRRVFGRSVALLSAALLAGNTAYLIFSTRVACEVLFALWVTLGWLYLVTFARTGKGGVRIGVMMGLAYWTKIVCVLGAPVVCVVIALRERRRLLVSRSFWSAVLVALLICSPLLVRKVTRPPNLKPKGPTLSRLFVGSVSEMSSLDKDVRTPSFGSFWRRYGLDGIVRRLTRGAVQEAIFVTVESGQTYFLNQRVGFKVWPVSLVIFAFAGLALLRCWRRTLIPVAALFGPFFLFFAWYPSDHMRFMFPMMPMILILAACGMVLFARALRRRWRAATTRGLRTTVLAVVLVMTLPGAVWAAARVAVREHPLAPATLPPGYYELHNWLAQSVTDETKVMMGRTDLYSYFWNPRFSTKAMDFPYVDSPDKFLQFLREQGVTHLVLDYSVLRIRGPCLQGWIETDGKRLRLIRIPPGWRVAFSASDPATAIVFDRVSFR
jgi:hypothetical protein